MTNRENQAKRAPLAVNRDSDTSTAVLDNAEIWQRALVRTLVHKRMPLAIRRKLDRAILLRPEGCRTLDAIEARFRLADKYGVSLENLRTYARKLERVAEPIFAGNLAAAIMGCMPATYRADVEAGSQIILISRLVQALTQSQNKFTPQIADLVKLSSALRSAASASDVTRACKTRGYKRDRHDRERMNKISSVTASLPTLTEAVKTVYGVDCPANQPSETETPALARPEMAK